MAADWERLVEQHLHLVHAIAAKLQPRLGKTMERGDLVGYGTQGLIEAARKYDPRHGTAFSTFAYYRIRGAMFDGMRTMAWYSRAEYARYCAEERGDAFLANAAAREAALGAARAAGGVATNKQDKTELLNDIAQLLGGVAAVRIACIEAAQAVPDDRFQAADARVEACEDRQRLRAALARLPEKERQLIELYYYADMNLDSAGAKLGLSKSWASRLHARAVTHLREALAEEPPARPK